MSSPLLGRSNQSWWLDDSPLVRGLSTGSHGAIPVIPRPIRLPDGVSRDLGASVGAGAAASGRAQQRDPRGDHGGPRLDDKEALGDTSFRFHSGHIPRGPTTANADECPQLAPKT